jgi:hypothetical protein
VTTKFLQILKITSARGIIKFSIDNNNNKENISSPTLQTKSKAACAHAMKIYVAEYFESFLTLALDGSDLSDSRPGRFTLGERVSATC